ncbi:hypothetical protein KKH56_07325 [bacterium]|nr:hypothetical protein [bacterium]
MIYLSIAALNFCLTLITKKAIERIGPDFRNKSFLRVIYLLDIIFDTALFWMVWALIVRSFFASRPGEAYFEFLKSYTLENMGLLGFVVGTRIVFEGIMGGKVKEEK